MPAIHRRILTVVHLCLLCPGLAPLLRGAPPAVHQVGVVLKPQTTRALTTYKGHEGQILHERRVNLYTGTQHFGLRYTAGYDPDIPERAFPLEGTIGMTAPSACNWYHAGFLWVLLDGQDVGTVPLSSMSNSEGGRRGIVDMVWHHPKGSVRVRFVALPGGDVLYAEATIEPTANLNSLMIKLRCYPSFFTSHHRRVGARRIRTPATLIEEGQNQVLPARDHPWAVYYDEVFDVAKREGNGPCAMAFSNDGATDIRHVPGGYAVDTTISFAPQTRRVRLAFWDLRGQTNDAALAAMPERAAAAIRDLNALDFTPATVSSFNSKAFGEFLGRAAKMPSADDDLRQRIGAAEHWLRELTLTKRRGREGKPGIREQESLLRSLSDYGELVWDVKLATLLAEL